MAKLQNELSWSRSRIATLSFCKRQYYYQYYQKWSGWEWDAPEEKKKAYFFSKMTDLAMMVGDAVHKTIKEILENVRDFGAIRIPDPELHARKLLSQVWQDAKARKWESSVKNHPPVFEIYYGHEPSADDLKALGAKAARCIANFVESPFFAELKRDDAKKDWIAIDIGPSFDEASKHRVRGFVTWALPDFVRRTSSDTCEIWDWKTGSPSPHDEMQLRTYALYVRDRYKFAPEKIRLRAFYLGDGRMSEYACSTDLLVAMEDAIVADFAVMHGMLEDVTKNEPKDRSQFPMIDDLGSCRRCAFKELCGR